MKKKYQEELREEYNIDDIFKKKEFIPKVEKTTENIDKNKLPVQAKRENIFKRVFTRIMKIFHIK